VDDRRVLRLLYAVGLRMAERALDISVFEERSLEATRAHQPSESTAVMCCERTKMVELA